MKISRLFTKTDQNGKNGINYVPRNSEIRNPDGKLIFSMQNILVPTSWSQVAVDILAQKYFRKAGVPKLLKKVAEEGVPEWLQPSAPDTENLSKLPENERFTSESDSR